MVGWVFGTQHGLRQEGAYNPHVFCDTNRSIYLSKGINSTKGLGREKPFGAPKGREHVIMDVFYSKNCPKKSFCNMDWKRCLGRAAGIIYIAFTTKNTCKDFCLGG